MSEGEKSYEEGSTECESHSREGTIAVSLLVVVETSRVVEDPQRVADLRLLHNVYSAVPGLIWERRAANITC